VTDEVLVCDTSGLLAALDRADPDHDACVAVLERNRGPLLLSPLVLAELDHLVRSRLGPEAARTLADDVAAGAYDLAPLTANDIARCVDVDRAYGDLGIGLADASLVVLAARARTRAVFTLDERHFRAIRPQHGRAFRLLPADR
jgi:predicted nucleic acid-binding protein